VTRLTEDDVSGLLRDLRSFEDGLRSVTGLDLRELALRTASDESSCVSLYGTRVAVVPISAGQGFIPGFSTCVSTILEHLGFESSVTSRSDVRGIEEATEAGAELLFLADDHRFIALNLSAKRSVDDDPATADGYVTALEAAAGGLVDRRVLLLGLGPVGRAAARRLLRCGARVHVVEPDAERLSEALVGGLNVEPTDLVSGLSACRLIFDASPAADVIDAADVTPATIAAVPGLPSAFTPAARDALGSRHIHEPLAVGVAVMAVRALVEPPSSHAPVGRHDRYHSM